MKIPVAVGAEIVLVLAVLRCDNLIAKLAAVQQVQRHFVVVALGAAAQRLHR